MFYAHVDTFTGLRDMMDYEKKDSSRLQVIAKKVGMELPEYLAAPDWEQWAPVTKWLESKRSQPA